MRKLKAQPVRLREVSSGFSVSARLDNPYSGTFIGSQAQEEAVGIVATRQRWIAAFGSVVSRDRLVGP